MNIRIDDFLITGNNQDLKVSEFGMVEDRTTKEKSYKEKSHWYPANLFQALISIRGRLITSYGITNVEELLSAIDKSTKQIKECVKK